MTDNFCLQFYLQKSLPRTIINFIARYRCSAHRLCIETGRYYNVAREIRLCSNCNTGQIEDEFHFILACTLYSDLRQAYIKRYYWTKPSTFKLIQLMGMQNIRQLRNFGILVFLKKATHRRDN